MYDIIIVGAGPAGLTSALYALRANKKVLVLEAKAYGGQIINANLLENYPGLPNVSGFDFATNLYNQVKDLGGIIKFETVIRIDSDKTVTTNKDKYQAKAIILATGAENRKLNIEREEELIGKGISYCATCDGNFYKNKTVAVIGGGDVALDDAVYLSEIAKKVYLIHRRKEFRGAESTLNLLKEKENVEILIDSEVDSILGDDKVTGILLKNKREIILDGIFSAIGMIPKTEILKELIDLDEYGYVKADETGETNLKGFFVAGDVRQKELRQIVTAVSDGANAATSAINYIRDNI